MLSALLTAGYLLPIVTNAFFPGHDFRREDVAKQQDTPLMRLTLYPVAAGVIVLGLFPGLIRPAVDGVIGALF